MDDVGVRAVKCQELETRLRRSLFSLSQDAALRNHNDVEILYELAKVGDDCGAIVMLAFDHSFQQLVVVKDYLHEDGDWKLPYTVLRQLDIYEALSTQLSCLIPSDAEHSVQECLDVQISKSQTRFIFRYYALSFERMFPRILPHTFLLAKTIELVRVVQTLHQVCGIAHRDIKPENICFTQTAQLVLIDFDSATIASSPETPNQSRPEKQNRAPFLLCKTVPVCSLLTRAPEQFYVELKQSSETSYDAFAGDWWAVGCVIAHMYLGTTLFPFEGNPTTIRSLERHYEKLRLFSEEFVKQTSHSAHATIKTLRRAITQPAIWSLLKGLLDMNPSLREQAVLRFLMAPCEFV